MTHMDKLTRLHETGYFPAEWQQEELEAVLELYNQGKLTGGSGELDAHRQAAAVFAAARADSTALLADYLTLVEAIQEGAFLAPLLE